MRASSRARAPAQYDQVTTIRRWISWKPPLQDWGDLQCAHEPLFQKRLATRFDRQHMCSLRRDRRRGTRLCRGERPAWSCRRAWRRLPGPASSAAISSQPIGRETDWLWGDDWIFRPQTWSTRKQRGHHQHEHRPLGTSLHVASSAKIRVDERRDGPSIRLLPAAALSSHV